MAIPAQGGNPKRKPRSLLAAAIIAPLGVICVCTMNIGGAPLGGVFFVAL